MSKNTPRISIGITLIDPNNPNEEMHRQRARLLHSLMETYKRGRPSQVLKMT